MQAYHLPAPVLVVEDDAPMQNRLRQLLLSMGYAHEALVFCQTLAAARARVSQDVFAMALVDLGLPDGTGLALISQLRQVDAQVPILVVSAWSDEEAILTALRAGASGYILKERDDVEVALSIRSVLRGGTPIDPFMARRILRQLAIAPDVGTNHRAENVVGGVADDVAEKPFVLTKREHEVLQLAAQGLSNREVAEYLKLSPHTVDSYIRNVYQKLAVSNRTKAIYTARAMGLLK